MQGFNMGRYVPPDLEGTASGNQIHRKHPLGARASKLASRGALTVRFEMPYAVWCSSCPRPTIIGQGVRFNAQKRRVGAYHTTPIWAFRFRHAACGGEIELRTDPQNTAYVVTEGGKKRDTGEDRVREGDEALQVLTDQEREKLRSNAFASLERTIADREQMRESSARIDGLMEASSRHWDDPYAQNQRLRKSFRQGRKEREKELVATEALKDKMGLGIDLVPATEEDAKRAQLVDFGADGEHQNQALSQPLFGADNTRKASSRGKSKSEKEVSLRKGSLVAEVLGNTRARKDPFLHYTEPRPATRPMGLRSKRKAEEEKDKGKQNNMPSSTAPSQEATALGGLVGYDSD